MKGRHLPPEICDGSGHISLENLTLFDNFMTLFRKKWRLMPIFFRLYLLIFSLGWKNDRPLWSDLLNIQLGLCSSVLGNYAMCGSVSGAEEFWLKDRENCGITEQL